MTDPVVPLPARAGQRLAGLRWVPLTTPLALGVSLVLAVALVPPPTVPVAAESTAAPTSLSFVAPPTTAAPGVALSPALAVQLKDGARTATSTSDVVLTLVRTGDASGSLTCTDDSVVPTADGLATFAGCSVDKGGSYTLVATLGTITAEAPLQVSGAAVLGYTSQPSDGAAGVALPTQPVVQVREDSGTAVIGASQQVAVIIAPGSGTAGAVLSCGTGTTADNVVDSDATTGLATFTGCRVDKPGTYQLLAYAQRDKVAGTSEEFTVAGGPAAALVFRTDPVGGATGGIVTQPVVDVVDAGGNTVLGSSAPVTLVASGPSGATISCSTTGTADGRAAFTGCSVTAPGTYTLTASSAGLTSATSAQFTVKAGGLAALDFSADPSGGAGGEAFGTQPTVTLLDAGGNASSGPVTLSLSGGPAGAQLVCDANPLLSDGNIAAFTGCSVDTVGQGYVLTATSGTATATSSPFAVTAGSIASLELTSATPIGVTGGTAFGDVTVRAYDEGDNAAAGAVALSLVPQLGTEGAALACAGTSVGTGTAVGTTTFSGCRIDLAGRGYRLQATVAGVPTAIDTTEAFDVAVGDADHLVFRTAPGGGTGGVAWAQQPVVTVEDEGGNRVVDSEAVVDLVLTGGPGALTCTSDPLGVTRGAALFAGCAVDTAGDAYHLTATSAGLSPAGADVTVSAGPASQLLFTGQPQRALPGAALTPAPQVTVADAGGNPASGSLLGTVALAITDGTGVAGAVLTCAPRAASASTATFSGCAVDTTGGGYALTAAWTGPTGRLTAESLPFNVVPAAPTALGRTGAPVPTEQTFGGRLYANNPTTVDDSVNTATGSLQTSVADLTVAGVGQDLELERSYNSLDTTGGAFGPGWSSVLDLAVAVNAAGTRAVVRGEDGQQVVFTRAKATAGWTAPAGARSSLTCTAKTCTVLRYDGTSFEVSGTQLVSHLDANGQGLRFAYEAGQLKRVLVSTTDTKKPLVVDVTTAAGRVTRVATPTRSVSYAYTTTGLLAGVTDVTGARWAYAYAGTRLTGITAPGETGPRLAAAYDTAGRVVSVVEGGSARRADSTFTWAAGSSTRRVATAAAGADATGRVAYTDTYRGNVLVSQAQPTGGALTYGYDAANNLTHVQDPAGWVQVMTYDAAGNLLSQSSPLGGGAASVVRMTYDNQRRMTSQRDSNGNITTYVYNGPNLGSVRPPGAGEGATKLTHDVQGLLVMTTTPLGRHVYTNDAYGNAVRTVQQDLAGLPLNGAGSTATYDEAGRTTSSTTALGFRSSWVFDLAGRVLTATTPDGVTRNEYSAAGVPTASTTSGERSTYAWDEASRTRTTVSPAGTSTQRYDRSGNLVRETSPAGEVTDRAYDELGREVATTTDALVVHYTFGDNSQLVLATDSDGYVLRQSPDAANRIVRRVADGDETRTSYDAAGNVTGTRDATGGTTTRTYDSHGNPSAVSDGNGTTTYAYDLADNVVRRTDGRGGVTTWTYDPMSRVSSMSVAAHRTTYAHDLDGRLVTTVDPEGRTTALTLDESGNALVTAYTGAGYRSVTVTQTFADGRRTSLDGSPVTYDDRGNMTRSGGFSYDYSTPGEVVETYPGGRRVTYAVDGTGNLMSVRAGEEGQPGYVGANYVRDGDRRATGLALSNGVFQSRAYDAAGNLVDQTVRLGGSVLSHDAYAWDARGNRVAQRSSVPGSTVEHGYAYEASGRLAGARTSLLTGPAAEQLEVGLTPVAPTQDGPVDDAVGLPGPAVAPALVQVPGLGITSPAGDLGYDAVGNRTSADGRSWTHGPADEIVTDSSGTTWTYDRSGAVTGRSGGTQPAATYSYDAAARLVGVTTAAGTVEYGYDGDGNRTSRTAGAVTTTYAWSPFGELPQLAVETTGAATTYYTHGEGPIAASTGTDVLFFHADPLGSTNAVTDAAGALVASYRYSAYGEVVGSGPRADDVDLLFQAQQLDRASGLYNMRARQYDPDSGRFTQREPAPTAVGVPVTSAYAFVGNQPTTKADPSGRTPDSSTVFAGQATQDANDANNAKYVAKGAQITIKVVAKVGGYSAALASASASGTQLTKAAKVGAKLKFAGAQLAIIGIGLQTLVAVENCRSGPVEKCVGSVVGLALNVGFTIGCSFITSGVGSFACAMCGAALGIGLEYVISEFGPEIVDGLIDAYEAIAPYVSEAALVVAAAFVDFGNDVAAATNEAIGVLVSATDDLVAGLETGYAEALALLADADLEAVRLGELLGSAFGLGGREVLAGLLVLGYAVSDAMVVFNEVFDQGIDAAAVFFTDSFAIATTELAAALDDAYRLGDEALTIALAGAGIAVTEIAVALETLTDLTAQGVADLLDAAEYGAVAVGAALSDVLDQSAAQIATVLAELDYTAAQVGVVLRDVEQILGAQAAVILKGVEGFFAEDVAGALNSVYDETAAAATAALLAAGYVADEIATGLLNAYAATAAETTQLLKDVGQTAEQVAVALTGIYGQFEQGTADLLHDAGFLAEDVAAALVQEFNVVADEAAGFLDDAGYSFTQVGVAMEDTFNQTAADTALLLQGIGAGSLEVAVALDGAFTIAGNEMAIALLGIGAGAEATALALQLVLGQTADDAVAALSAAGYAIADIGTALVGVFDQTANETAALLKSIGASTEQVVAMLGAEFDIVGAAALNGILTGVGYAADLIADAGAALEDFGNDVADFFSGWF